VIGAFVGGGALILTVVGILFKVNHDFCKENRKNIDDTNKYFNDINTRLSVIETIFRIKWGEKIVNEAKKKNGDI